MNKRMWWLLLVVLVAGARGGAQAQFNGFASASYGYHSDPLYNYETIPDQLRQGYLELQYLQPVGKGTLSAAYVGGLMVFNTFTDRNYLEHSLRLGYRNAFGTPPPLSRRPGIPPAATQEEGDEENGEEDEEEDDRPVDPDSVRTFLDLQLRGSARHDKQAYREFDNTGIALTAVLRMPVRRWYIRVLNDVGMRSYTDLPELSNLTEHLTLQTGRVFRNGLSVGFAASGGMKYYTTDLVDTTQFESVRTYVEKENGKGKGGAKLVVPSDKKILTNATTTISWQVAAGIFGGFTWDGGSVLADGWYRINPGNGTRYLAQYANSSMLSEDIYTDFFSYDGPEGRIIWKQGLPLGLQSIITCGIASKQFEAPALDLTGTEAGVSRRDVHSYAEIWLSRYITLSDGLGLDVALSGAVVRNQSNDAYNDFGLYQVGVSIGLGF